MHSLLIARGGDLVLEEYFMGFDAGKPHNLRSATKSVIATLVAAALQRGEIALDDRPLKRIARERDLTISAHKARLTLADLLDMRHGLQCDDWVTDSPGNESQIYGQDDWTAFILAIPDNEKMGTNGAPTYCSAMPLMVGRYLELVTGKLLPEYADEVLFRPLGIARDDWTWNLGLSANKQQMGAQVHLRPRDMLRIARLYASDGAVKGRQLLPPGWVGETFRAETPLGDWRRYHNFWWAYDVDRPGKDPVTVNMASGIGGQKIALVPDLELAVVMTGGSFSQGRPGPTRIIERVLRSL